MDSEPAFPFEYDDPEGEEMVHPGMTLLDYFAGQALVGLLSNANIHKNTTKKAYEFAEAMMEERSS